MKYRNHHLIVENKNLRNKMKTMENEMKDVKDALSLEEFQCSLLTENLHSKLVRSMYINFVHAQTMDRVFRAL